MAYRDLREKMNLDAKSWVLGDDYSQAPTCATCHSTKPHPPINVSQTVRPDNCVGCHMPRVAPQAHLRFTNHWIGVYQDGACRADSYAAADAC